ncbi:hypothetical protein PCASD_17008 [Puccinia coronata f. sp. avenae]|uniref:mRNA cap guanine-N(7) methyltransferase n=1 Tax=Puccinia coronata f. sp. avenae TaxID=200324 RepID=A0A2N5T9V4_9BASI|nr:hypothetical protein PCASD_17008 [Puccinia coronata f. sp. avenae]
MGCDSSGPSATPNYTLPPPRRWRIFRCTLSRCTARICRMDGRIAYHPIRVCPHASLFLPLSEQELKVYHTESLNTLRVYSHPESNLLGNRHPRDPHLHLNSEDSARPPSPHPTSDAGSPVGYSTPSPLAIPLPASHHPHEPHLPQQSSSTNKRPIQATEDKSEDLSAASPNMLYATDRQGLTGDPNKRTRHNPSLHHSADADAQDSSISDTVAQHYNMRPNLTKGARTGSPIFGLRKFNNWIKSVTIGKFASVESSFMAPLLGYNQRQQHFHSSHPQSKGTKILDLGCGKGGDLAKWQNAGVREFYGFDIAEISIEQANSRYEENCNQRFYAKFVALDCFSLPIDSVLSPEELREPFHAVSLQFCMHYAFESEVKARTMLENVSKHLVTGGVMIGTIPNPDLLIDKWERCSPESQDDTPSFGNPVYSISFPYRLTSRDQLDQIYGNRYSFYLQDAVEDVPEYLVLWEPFVRLAQEYGLKLVYKKAFHEIFQIEKATPVYRNLLYRMRVINPDGSLSIPSDQWDASEATEVTSVAQTDFISAGPTDTLEQRHNVSVGAADVTSVW